MNCFLSFPNSEAYTNCLSFFVRNLHYLAKPVNRRLQEGRVKEEISISPGKLHSCQAELNQKAFEPLFIPTRVSLLPLHNKSRIFSNPVTEGFIDSQNGLGINEFDKKTVFMESDQLSDPVAKFQVLLL